MRDLFFGDRRDRVKWAVLVHLARANRLRTILQVAYARCTENPSLEGPGRSIPVDHAVWQFFSALERVSELGPSLGVAIEVLDAPFAHTSRASYAALVKDRISHLERPALVFLDPDTGISDSPDAMHASRAEVRLVWGALQPREWLVVYQHADHTSTWLDRRRNLLKDWCGRVDVAVYTGRQIAGDVAFLAVEKR